MLDKLKIDHNWSSFLRFRSRRLQGVPTHIESLDRAIFGLSGITVIQGAPGVNKSSLALQIGAEQAKRGNPVLMIDRENGRERVRMRLTCMINQVSQIDVLTCNEEKLKSYLRAIKDLPLYVETAPLETYEDVKARIAAVYEAHPDKPLLLIVDSLQSLPAIDAGERQSLQKWMLLFDQAKLDYEGRLTILMTSEKRRGEGGLDYERASLSAAKGSGAAEYKSELVLDLRRNHENGHVICSVVKNRDGASGVEVELRPVLAHPGNKQSFVFKLEGA